MFNEEMKLTAQNELDLYVKMAIKNIDFALISLDYILNTQKINYKIYFDDHTFYFYYIQNLLAACGNISNIFNSPFTFRKVGRVSPHERSKELCEYCGVDVRLFPLIFEREARNTNMHFDERYDEAGRRIGDYNIIDENTSIDMRDAILNTPHLRTYLKQEQVYITVNAKNGRRLEYPLVQLREQLKNLKALLLRQ